MGMRIDRRTFLGSAGAGVAGLAVGAGSATALESAGGDGGGVVAFHGPRQAGIVTPTQARLHIAAFDVVDGTSRAALGDLLRAWTQAAATLTAGRALGEADPSPLAPPADTGEAEGLAPANLTVTFGFGPALFGRGGADRFGLAARRPAALRRLPPLPGDQLDPARSDGDLCVQACADEPEIAFHAVRNLARIGRGTVVMRWSQLGFGRTARTAAGQDAPRNLMGFQDGTNNITADEEDALRRHVWVGAEAPPWLRGGTYMVTRRIRMLIEVWDRASLADQEATIGRHKRAGDKLRDMPADAHIRLAEPAANGGQRILRRGYSFTDGFDPELGQLDAGLFFIAFQRDPQRQFAAIQTRLGADALGEYIKHTSSAVFAVPPGVRDGRDHVGRALLEA
jgi:deferrochelatase/peroxidase EfeB